MDLNSTIFGQMIAFFLFIWFCMNYIWPHLISIISKREILIKKALDDVQEKKKNIKNMYLQANNEIILSKKKAIDIINDANKKKMLILEKAKIRAKQEKEKIILQAKKTIEIEKIKLRQELTKEVSTLATLMANKIILNTVENKKIDDIENSINHL